MLALFALASGCSKPTAPTPVLITDTFTGLLNVLGTESQNFTVKYTAQDTGASITVTSLRLASTNAEFTSTIGVAFGAFDVNGVCQRAAGFVVGFGGVIVLIGPAALTGLGTQALAQAAVLGGALCYAGNSVLARRTVAGDFLVASTAVLIVASVLMVPIALWVDHPWTSAPSAASLAAIVWLGLGPTALATILYFRLIAAAGPTFMAIVNYLSPMVALLAGIALMGEHPGTAAVAGLLLILLGIAVSRGAISRLA